MHDHLGHLNLVSGKAIFADSWNEGGQKHQKIKNKKQYSQTLWRGGPSHEPTQLLFKC